MKNIDICIYYVSIHTCKKFQGHQISFERVIAMHVDGYDSS